MQGKLTKEEILNTLEKNRGSLKKLGVKKIGLFGSYLKGAATKKSDIDILVSFNRATFDAYMDLKFMLESVFKRRVDLVIENSLKPSMLYVKKEAVYAKAA